MISTVGGMSLDLLPLRQKILSKIKTRELEDEQEDKTVAEIEPEDEEVEVSGKVKENDPERLARVIINDIILYNVKEVENGLQNKDLYRTLKDTILQSKELYLSRFDDISSFERQLIETLAKGDKDALKGYKFETIQ